MRSKLEWRAARVISIENPAEDVRAVTFAVEGLRSAFDPGSHTNIKVTIKGEPALRTWDMWVHAYLILGLVETARHAGYAAQATSIPGVAQRTGATVLRLLVMLARQKLVHSSVAAWSCARFPTRCSACGTSACPTRFASCSTVRAD